MLESNPGLQGLYASTKLLPPIVQEFSIGPARQYGFQFHYSYLNTGQLESFLQWLKHQSFLGYLSAVLWCGIYRSSTFNESNLSNQAFNKGWSFFHLALSLFYSLSLCLSQIYSLSVLVFLSAAFSPSFSLPLINNLCLCILSPPSFFLLSHPLFSLSGHRFLSHSSMFPSALTIPSVFSLSLSSSLPIFLLSLPSFSF